CQRPTWSPAVFRQPELPILCAVPARMQASTHGMVENTGLEPVTSWLQTRRSPSLANSPKIVWWRKRPRQPQLAHATAPASEGLVGLSRFELLTPRLSSVCSNQLSYRPKPTGDRTPASKNPTRADRGRRFSQNWIERARTKPCARRVRRTRLARVPDR